MAMYGKLEYWQERYAHSGESTTYDWYQNYESLKHLMSGESLTKPFTSNKSTVQVQSVEEVGCLDEKVVSLFPSRNKCRVLILGCGNSSFGEDMRSDGWTGEIINMDFSSVVIDQMRKKYNCVAPEMEFVCADVTNGLPFKDESFDLIVCKGTFDSILCIGSVSCAKNLIADCSRVLAEGHGCLFLVSYGSPDNRAVFLEHQNDVSYYWEGIDIRKVPRNNLVGSKNDYVYICRKKWNDTEDATRNNDVLKYPATKKLGEENVDQIDEHFVQKNSEARELYQEL